MLESIQAALEALAVSRKKLTDLLPSLKGNKVISTNEEALAFVFDLQDYSDAIRLVTDFVTVEVEDQAVTPKEISQLFSEQRESLEILITEFTRLSDEMEEGHYTESFYGLKAGGVRRLSGGLQGVLEMNGQLLQENLTFQRLIKDVDVSSGIQAEESEEKTGFFRKLFGK